MKGHLSIYLCLLQFRPLMSHNSQCTGLSWIDVVPECFVVFGAIGNVIHRPSKSHLCHQMLCSHMES